MSRYPIPAKRTRNVQVINRSRYITTVAPVATVDQAREEVASVRAEFPDASHHCFAFVVGPPGSTAQVGMSDDGEPSGTAGRPMLAQLLGSGVGDVVAVATRYFGGIKLGTGGLVRAYGGAAKAALAEAELIEKVDRVLITVTGDYRWITPLERALPEFEAEILSREFGENARWILSLPEERDEALRARLVDMSAGTIVFQPVSEHA